MRLTATSGPDRLPVQQLDPSIMDDLGRQRAQSVKAGAAAAVAVALTDEHDAASWVMIDP
jgi:hypothetical protein